MPFLQVVRCFGRCRKYLKGYRGSLAVLGLAMNGYTVLAMAVPIVNRAVFDQVIPRKDMHLLLKLCGVMVLLTLALAGLSSLRGYLTTRLGQELASTVRLDLYGHLLRLPLAVLTKQQVGDLMARVQGDAGRVAGFLEDTLIALIANSFTLVLALSLIFEANWRLGLMALVFVPAFGSTFFLYRTRHYRLGQAFFRKEGEFASALQEGLSGIPAIKCSGSELREVERLRGKAREVIAVSLRLFWVQNGALVLALLVSTLAGAGMILFGAEQVIRGHMTIGAVVAIQTWLTMTAGPINQLAQQYLHLQQILGSVQRVLDLFEIPPEGEEPQRTHLLPEEAGGIVFEDVAFRYGPDRAPVLQGLSLTVRRGEKLAIAGVSGAGKTTIVSLLMGLYRPEKGVIRIGGYDIATVRLESLRGRIALVSQDPFLFNTSVLENIRYGRPGASEEEVVAAARAACAHEFILQLPQGYGTEVGERGVTLSGGQRQRIAIARAFLKEAPILILDEATAAVDVEAESLIQESLERLMRGKTVIVISHRLSALQAADRIAVLEGGRIVATGTHRDLAAEGGLYQSLWALQPG